MREEDGQDRQNLLLAYMYFSKNEIIKKGVEERMLVFLNIILGLDVILLVFHIKQLNKKLEDYKYENVDLHEENLKLYEENKDLRFDNEEQYDLIIRVKNLVNANKYNNEKAILGKIKELVSDYQSIN